MREGVRFRLLMFPVLAFRFMNFNHGGFGATALPVRRAMEATVCVILPGDESLGVSAMCATGVC